MEARDKRAHKAQIEAAQHWLDKAASSLEAENEIRSDLHLMLAEAELYRAKRRRAWYKLAAWALPPLVAGALVAGGYALWGEEGDRAAETAETGTIIADVRADGAGNKNFAGKTVNRVETHKDGDYLPNAAPIPPTAADTAFVPDGTSPARRTDVAERPAQAPVTEDATGASSDVPASEEKRSVPDTDVQQLMQSAAIILRK